jgi:hypothetical protein
MNGKSSGGEASGPDLDLFGHEVRPLRERRGRPSFAKTLENQMFVEVRVAAGWAVSAIADVMGIHEDTLRKHFSAEIRMGALRIEGMELDVLLQKVREGHVPSIRELRERRERSHPRVKPPADPAGAKPAKPGKKEIAAAEAQRPSPGWSELLVKLPPSGKN